MQCIINGCTNNAEHNLGIRLRRPETTAIWAPNSNAYICDAHATAGLKIHILLEPTSDGHVETFVSSSGGQIASRRTPIENEV